MQKRPITALIVAGIIICWSTIYGWAQELGDPGFEALIGKTVSHEAVTGEWSIPAGQPYADSIVVKADATTARTGKAGLKLQTLTGGREAAVHQQIPQLAAGIYEFKVWAKGKVCWF